jgi:tRNA A-37 threonylcarbamoyl transferase component Bud32
MTIQLTAQQQEALDSSGAMPPEVVDPRTNTAYVLIPAVEYETFREVVEDERRQGAVRTVALRNAAGRMHEAP